MKKTLLVVLISGLFPVLTVEAKPPWAKEKQTEKHQDMGKENSKSRGHHWGWGRGNAGKENKKTGLERAEEVRHHGEKNAHMENKEYKNHGSHDQKVRGKEATEVSSAKEQATAGAAPAPTKKEVRKAQRQAREAMDKAEKARTRAEKARADAQKKERVAQEAIARNKGERARKRAQKAARKAQEKAQRLEKEAADAKAAADQAVKRLPRGVQPAPAQKGLSKFLSFFQ